MHPHDGVDLWVCDEPLRRTLQNLLAILSNMLRRTMFEHAMNCLSRAEHYLIAAPKYD